MLRNLLLWFALLSLPLSPMLATAAVDIEIIQRLALPEEPLDAVVPPNDNHIYVLTRAGDVIIFNAQGKQTDIVPVGKDIKAIRIGPGGDSLLLLSPNNRQVSLALVNFVYAINTEGNPFKGNRDAPVEMVVFSDFQCPYCARLLPTFEQVLEQYPDKVKLVFKNYPLRSHQYALKAAAAALAAHSQKQFWAFHDQLFENYNRLNDQKINQIATDLKIDPDTFKQQQESVEVQNLIRRDMQDAKAANVRGTPSVFINGRLLKRRNLNGFKTAIEAELQRLPKNP